MRAEQRFTFDTSFEAMFDVANIGESSTANNFDHLVVQYSSKASLSSSSTEHCRTLSESRELIRISCRGIRFLRRRVDSMHVLTTSRS